MDLTFKTLKRSAAVSVAALFAATAAHAADLPQELPPDPDIFNWTGPYVGGHLGYAVEGDAAMRFPGGTLNADLDGILGGIYGGYNYQMNGFVLGGEADVTFGDIDGSAPPVSRFEVDVQGSVRLRAGLAYDRILPYLTVGLGIASAEQTIPGGGSPSNVHLGVVAGGGIDWALSENLSARVEYLYSYYGRERYNHTAVSSRTDFDNHVVRGGLSWHFGSYVR
ncbi:MAG: outer membrane beta-barrel protein [Pseudomonadota bacterium]